MVPLALHNFHSELEARFTDVNGFEAVSDYGDFESEHSAFRNAAGILDLGFRSRIVLTGADRVRFLNGQVTNNVKDLSLGEGCYAALVSSRGRMQSDLNIYLLAEEILLDFEPGLASKVTDILNRFIIADDVQLIDAAPHYGLLSVQGPAALSVIESLNLNLALPEKENHWRSIQHEVLGEIYCMRVSRTSSIGFDVFVPTHSLETIARSLQRSSEKIGGRYCGWQALETARIEAGIPRFGAEMDETNLVPETGIDSRAVSYTKGCYTGQEIIARIRTYGQVAKALRGLRLADDLTALPVKGDKLMAGDREAGFISSATHSPTLKANIALGYVRREQNQIGTELRVRTKQGEGRTAIVELPFVNQPTMPQPS